MSLGGDFTQHITITTQLIFCPFVTNQHFAHTCYRYSSLPEIAFPFYLQLLSLSSSLLLFHTPSDESGLPTFFKVYFIDYAITVVPLFSSPLFPSILHSPSNHHSPHQFMSMGGTYKFFGFSISYTILTLPLSILYLSFMFLIPCTSSLIPPLSPSC